MNEPLRVAVVRGESLMEQAIVHALTKVQDLEVEVLPADAADLAANLRTFKPHAVIADEMERTFIDYILATNPGTVVVTLSVHLPQIGVYRSKQVPVASMDGLVAQVRREVGKTMGHRTGNVSSDSGQHIGQ